MMCPSFHSSSFPVFLLSILFCLRLTGQIFPDTLEARWCLEEAEDLKSAYRTKQAIPLFEKSAEVFYEAGRWAEWVRSTSLMADCHQRIGNKEKSLSLLKAAEKIALNKLGENHPALATNLFYQSQYYRFVGKLDSTKLFLDAAWDIWSGLPGNYTGELALTRAQIAMTYYIPREYEASVPHFLEALQIARQDPVKHSTLIGNILTMVGLVEQYRGNYKKAIEYFREDLEVLDENMPGYHSAASFALSNLGANYLKMGDPELSLSYFQQAVIMVSNIREDHVFLGFAYEGEGLAYIEMEEFDKALESFNKSMEVYLKNPNDVMTEEGLSKVYLNLGLVNEKRKLDDLTVESLRKGLKLTKNAAIQAEYYRILSRIYIRQENYDSAHWATNTALSKMTRILGRFSSMTAETYLDAGFIYFSEGRLEQALEMTLKAIEGFTTGQNNLKLANMQYYDTGLFGAISQKGQILESLYHNCDDYKYLPSALNTYQQGLELLNAKVTELPGDNARSAMMKDGFAILEGGMRVCDLLYRETNDPAYLEKAYTFCEKSKAVSLVTSLLKTRSKQYAGISSDILTQESNMAGLVSYYKKLLIDEQLKEEKADEKNMNLFRSKIIEYYEKRDSILQIIEEQTPGYYWLMYESRTRSLPEVQKRLSTGEQLVEFFLSDSTLYTFAITNEDISYHRQPVDTFFFKAIDRLRSIVSSPPDNEHFENEYRQFISDSRYLYRTLLEPILNERNNGSLVVIPDGALNFIPFNLLLSGKPDSLTLTLWDYRNLPYLVNKYDIRYEYSATLMTETARHENNIFPVLFESGNHSYCGFAPIYDNEELLASRENADSLKLASLYPGLFRGKLSNLQYTRPEVETAGRLMNGLSYLGEHATESNFKQQAGKAKILHLAMHALTNDKEPLFSQLAFSDPGPHAKEDARLYAYELYNMQLKADLAVLSACNTGVGRFKRGEGVLSLCRAFKYAGCPNVVMSLWQADDYSTQLIVTDFFKNLKEGTGKDQALCNAQRSFFTNISNQRLTHPHYWATLLLVGDGEPISQDGFSASWVLFAILLVAVGIGYKFLRS